ncbi:MAG: CotH kinase family protein [Phycisphaerales bacterium JB050]
MHRPRSIYIALAMLVSASLASLANAQDLYDTSVLRSFNITFHDSNWLQLLRQNYSTETPILADLEVDGEVYPDVGVRIRGNTSYIALPPGSEKFSLKIYMDFVHEDQELMGYDNINLNNAFRDPTFCREVVYNNFVAQFIPNPRANHAIVSLNGENWGVYINVQQPDKTMLRDFFANADGLRIKCANNPNGPGLTYNGSLPSGYTGYEIQSEGDLEDPMGALIEVCDAVTNGAADQWEQIDELFAIDPSIWSVVLENLLTDDDSYVNKGADFMTYRDPLDGRMHILQRDANETFSQTTWSPIRNFTASNKPVLSNVLSNPELRQRYMAHYRTAMQDLNWDYFGPIFEAHRNLIDEAVQADPKKLYSYTLFQNNFTSTVSLPSGGPGGGSVPGLQQFVTQRAAFLDSNAELNASGPIIGTVQASSESPAPSEPVWISAAVAASDSPVARVELYYRASPNTPYSRVNMSDDGESQDGAAGDGVYGALLPISASGGQTVQYYVAATSSNAYGSVSFAPALAERAPNTIQYSAGDTGIRITEWMYSGDSGEFFELTNVSDQPVDLTGWSFDDDHRVAGSFDLSAFGIVAPGESVIVTESDAAAFSDAWAMDPAIKVIGLLGESTGNNLGRNDEINIYDQSGNLADRLTYGDQNIPDSIRTQNSSGQTEVENLGTNDALQWSLSAESDSFGSYAASTGEFGTPGTYDASGCTDFEGDTNGDHAVDLADLNAVLSQFGQSGSELSGDVTGDDSVDLADLNLVLSMFGETCE